MVSVTALVDEGLGNSSYLVDVGDGRALVIDPSRDATPYLAAAERAGLSIAFTAETHLHADFLTGSRELAERGASVLAARAAGLEWPHRGFAHGDEVDLGGLGLRALATPGHTPEHLAWLLTEGSRPVALFSGGALLVGAVARTDLVAPDRTVPLARALWRSLRETVLALPDDLPVYPTHGAGSFCAAPAGVERTTTIGRERATNPLLAAPDEDTFVQRLLDGYGSYPPYFLRLRDRNRRGFDVVGSPLPSLAPLSVDDVQAVVAAGGVVVDVRPVSAWAAAHVPKSVAIPLRPQFGSWLGWLLPDDRPLAFVLDGGQDGREVVRQALTIGYEHLAGALDGGMEAWRAAGLPVATVDIVAPAGLDRPVVDVRQEAEYAGGYVPGAVHVELGDLEDRVASLPTGPLAFMCGHGERAATAASLAERAGWTELAVVVGGPS